MSLLFKNAENIHNYVTYVEKKGIDEQFKPKHMEGLVDPDSKEWYYVAPYQILVPITALTDKGKQFYKEACKRAENECPKNTIENAFYQYVTSGSWYPCKTSPHYDPNDYGMINAMNDLIVHGYKKGNVEMCTSQIKWKGETSKGQQWVITNSGSLYYVNLK